MKKFIEALIVLILLITLVFIGKNKLAAFYYNQGYESYEAKLYKEAVKYFNKSISINPSVVLVHYGLGNAYLQEGLEEKAIKEYKEAIKLNSRFVWGYESLADIYTRKGLYKETIEMLSQAQTIADGNKEIADLIKYTSSIYLSALLNTSIDAFQANDKLKAYGLLNKAIEVKPDFAYTHYVLGYFYYIDQKYDQAIIALGDAIRIDNRFYLAYKLLGDIYFKEHLFYKAINEYRKVLLIDKRNSVVLSNLGLAYMNLEKYEEAESFLREALSFSPNNINFRYSLASIYKDRGKLKEAALEYKKVIDMRIDYPNVHNDLGDIYRQEVQTEEADKEYQKEITICQKRLLKDPNNPFTLNDIAYAYSRIKEYNLARKNINKSIALKPDYQEAYLTLAMIQKALGEHNKALVSLEKAKGLVKQKQVFIDNEALSVKEGLKTHFQGKENFQPVDTVYLKNGRIFQGIIQKDNKESITLEIKIGTSSGAVTLYRNDIERIIKGKRI